MDFQTSSRIGVNFKVSDPESHVLKCSWGIGKSFVTECSTECRHSFYKKHNGNTSM